VNEAASHAGQSELFPIAAEPQWRSCDMQLADNPTASALAKQAQAYTVDHALTKASELTVPTTWTMLADDPTDRSHLLLFIEIERQGFTEQQINQSGASATRLPGGRLSIVVIIDKATSQPINAGVLALP